ncbi:MAG: hypothetical protein ABUK01_18375 [Leptospirales bacterium]
MKKNGKTSHKEYMKNKSVYRKLKVPVDYILEIRLGIGSWNQIKSVATARDLTCSWVVRYAVFRMIKRRNLQGYITGAGSLVMDKKFKLLNERVKANRAGSADKHRHKLCLYGEDEMFIRLAAMQMRCTMTHLVRLALEYYLPRMVSKIQTVGFLPLGFFSRSSTYWLGIKLYAGVTIPGRRGIEQVHIKFRSFEKSDYW